MSVIIEGKGNVLIFVNQHKLIVFEFPQAIFINIAYPVGVAVIDSFFFHKIIFQVVLSCEDPKADGHKIQSSRLLQYRFAKVLTLPGSNNSSQQLI
jgi:hypothetical protein